ncbi:hypothetical protein [Candidatus Laterigemmans baculatus]|uniref:hypothetical protein n=1 Tax=Candidatus Laterigemmans baculatus TaxID=2770505 RepID=UPI0013DA9721|nr:hypothetical protein [Candidatus Laterigemmans baculatus]
MSRRSRHALAPNLFPFLAVLVCTMGTLILLLALVAQKAKDSAAQIAHSQTQAAKLQTEEEQWRAEELQKLRARQTAELEKRRSELAHLEAHLRRLRQELAELADEAAAAERPSDATTAQAEARLVSLRSRVAEEKQRLEELQQAQSGRPPRVVIVPYQGTHGTDRRPVYVECTDQAVIIQPEGVRITAEHLEGPLGPGNPLDAALRAVRDHWQQTDPESPPPYPLLLVRPGGIHAYAACRIAMTAWDDQFGYELISDDLRLGFPEADPELHDKLVQTIHQAVLRQKAKIAAMPGRYGSLSREAVAASNGQLGPGGGLEPGNLNRQAPTAGSSNLSRKALAAGSGTANGQEPTAGSSNLSRKALAAGSETANGQEPTAGSSNLSREALAAGSETANGQEPTAGSAEANRHSLAASPAGSAPQTGPGLAPTAQESGPGLAPTAQGDRSEGNIAGDVSNPLSGDGGTETEGQISGGGQGSGSGSSASSQTPPSGVNAAAGAAAPPVGSPMQTPPPPDPHAKMFSEAAESPNFQASRRGSDADQPPELHAGNDWALPASMSGRRGTSIVRQMRLQCEPDRFVLLPAGRSNGEPRIIAVRDEDVQQAVVELGAALRERVESWGLAMQNGRWDPVLVVTVAAGAERRFEQLQTLLRGSGVRVEQEKPQ